MNRFISRAVPAILVAFLAVTASDTASAQGDSVLSQARASIANDRAALASSTRGNAADSLAAFLVQRGADKQTVDSLVERGNFTGAAGMRFARFEQSIGGLRVHGAYAKLAFDSQGSLIHVIERTVPASQSVSRSVIGDVDALSAAVALNFGNGVAVPGVASREGAVTRFDKTGFFYQSPTVERVVVARGKGSLEEGFLVQNWSADDNLLYHTLVDGRGRVVENELRTAEDSYNIFPDHPGISTQTVTAGAGSGNAESPVGWLGTQTQYDNFIQGNNVRAYLDRDNNNAPDGGGTVVSDGNFIATANLSQQPTTATNQAVAVQNLFYLNNVIHDTLYRHGFTEATGNFQMDNFGRGGAGNDAVNAEAQDGSGTNNANFATPSDGSPGRMQMYLWTYTNPGRDGDLDSDIVWHEYGHGLTWRMIGSMSGSVSGAIGEGMSDVLSLLANDDDVVGEYSTNNPNGIRSAPYTNYPRTLGDFGGSSVHFDGEIYAATIWALKARYNDDDALLTDLVGGMNFTPAGPDYPDMRDGILAYVSGRGGDVCPVWEAFAQFGIGEGASMSVKGGGPFGGRVSVTESFSVPSTCSGEPPPPPPPPSGDATLTDLTGTSAQQGRNRWRATVTASIDVDGATATISWSDGSTTNCTTSGGVCESSASFRNNVASVTATVTQIDGATPNVATGVSTSVTIIRP